MKPTKLQLIWFATEIIDRMRHCGTDDDPDVAKIVREAAIHHGIDMLPEPSDE